MKITHDLHIHTYLSACCKAKEQMTVANIIEAASELGLETIGFSDHVWMNEAIEPSGFYKSQGASQIARLRSDLAECKDIPLRISVGCEADTRAPGEFSITPEFAESLDHVLLSCSHFHMTRFVEQPADTAPASVAKHLIKFFTSGIRTGWATAIAHPFLPVGDTARLDAILGSISEMEFKDVLGEAAERGVAIEIATGFLPDPANKETFSIETPLRMLALAKEVGCKFSFGSDAHDFTRLYRLPELHYFVNALNLTEKDLLLFV